MTFFGTDSIVIFNNQKLSNNESVFEEMNHNFRMNLDFQ